MKITRQEIFEWIKEQGAEKCVVSFDGGGDEGGVREIKLINKDNVIKTLEEQYVEEQYIWNEMTKKFETPEIPHSVRINKAICEPVYDKYGSFAGEFNVSGQVTWDATNNTVKIDGSESVESWEDFEEEL